ncbi:MAG: MBL fold metallo-hydrolase [Burkholderiales bacterium]|nr:MBL fold metallo-hydrolase [Burkholderiales bacterium]
MQLRILGCSGGIGGTLQTTSMLLDHDILIDAGTGVTHLTLSELEQIDHVFLTHAHLDHIAALPFIVDTVGPIRKRPLTVHCLPEVKKSLQDHIFNWKIWPDFGQIPSKEEPILLWHPIEVGERVDLDARKLTALPANHTVPAAGYWLDSGDSSLVFTGDTTSNDALWEVVNTISDLRYLIIETAFPNTERELAIHSKHLCPSLLVDELAKLKVPAQVFITHLKPGAGTQTMAEIEEGASKHSPRMLANGQVFRF